MMDQMAELPQAVQIWVNWMGLVFLASIAFVWRHVEARWALAAFLLTMPIAMGLFAVWENVHLFGIAHLFLWGPLLAYLVSRWRLSGDPKYASWGAYRVWLTLLLATVAVSLVFDVRDLWLVATGAKS